MENEKTKAKSKSYGFDCVSKPVPPGTKSRGRLPRPGDPEPSLLRVWGPLGAVVVAALVLGVLIGRLLLP